MKYCRLSDERAKEVFGKRARIEDKSLIVPYSGSNIGQNGVPYVNLAMPFLGVPLNKNGIIFDPRGGFRNAELVKTFYDKFDEETIIIPGIKIERPESGTKKKFFRVTFNPNKIEYVLIGWKCDQNTSEIVRNELQNLARCTYKGKPDSTGVFWDYYVFSFMMDYNRVAYTDEYLLSKAKFCASAETVKLRRKLFGEIMTEIFGDLSQLGEVVLDTDLRQIQKEISAEEAAKKLKTEGGTDEKPAIEISRDVKTWQLKDRLHHYETYVIDEAGRFIAPSLTPRYISKENIADAEVSSYQHWKDLPEKCIVLRYTRDGVSKPAKYDFLRRPENVTDFQYDAIEVLEQQLLKETYEIVMKQKLFERFALRGPEMRWTQQLKAT